METGGIQAKMTALEQFVRLEALGQWRETPDAKPREVIVSFGNTTLVLRDMNDYPLGHWALQATRVIRHDEISVTYSTDPDAAETLEINDFEMIRAIETVSAFRARPLRRAMAGRRWILAVAALALLAAALFWGPDLLRRYAASSVPRTQAEQIGLDVLTSLTRVQGPVCNSPVAQQAATRFMARLFAGDAAWRVHFIDLGTRPTASLPGGHILVNSAVLDTLGEPDELAGFVALEAARASAGAPLAALLGDAGLGVTFRLLMRGQIDRAAADATAGQILTGTELPELRYDLAALERLKAASVSPRPFASALTRAGVEYSRASGFDVAPAAGTEPVLNDQDWVALQDICAG